MRIISIFLVLASLVFNTTLAATAETYRFRTFSPKGGFNYDGVVDIGQDSDGFIWIMLDKDLLRFDGHEYRKYTQQFTERDPGGYWSFNNFSTDSSGNLYVLTSNAAYKFDGSSDSFVKAIDDTLDVMEIDRQDNIWCLKDGVLNRIDPSGGSMMEATYNNEPVKGTRHFTFGDDRLFFGSRSIIYTSSYDSPDSLELLYRFPQEYSIVKLREDHGALWILTARDGVFRLNPSTRSIEKRIRFQDEKDVALLKDFLVDRNGRLWVGSQIGLYVIDPASGELTHYVHSKADPFSLVTNSVWTLFSDRNGNIWMGHFGGGLCYADLDDNLQIGTYTSLMSTLSYELVTSFAEYGDLIYIGTSGGGLNCLDKKTGKISQVIIPGLDNLNNVKSLAIDSLDRLWIATYLNGLVCYDLRSKKVRNFLHSKDDPSGLKINDLRRIILDRDAGLWIAYQNSNTLVSYLSFGDEKFHHYDFGYNGNPALGFICDIQQDSQGNLYAITLQKLFRIDARTREMEEISGGNFYDAQSLAIDTADNVWIGTVGRGLVKYDPSTGSFTLIPDAVAAYASGIYSICHDTATDCLWLGTDNGLIQFDPRDNSARKFDECDGFQGQVYYPLSAFKSPSGQMFFGGTNGFSIFNPGSIKQNTRKPVPRISSFYIDNKQVSPSVWKTADGIELKHDQANFGFRFSSDNYQTPEKNRFKYRLKGYDDGWITTDASNRTAMYAKVPPGKYRFELYASNNDGVWSDSPTVIPVIIHPAPWASPVAYFIYFILAAIIAWIVFHHWNEKRKLKIRLFMEALDKQKKDELHKSQLTFFTNISHDFRTPISLILAAIDNMKQEGIKDYYYRILHNNARRLLNLVNELMDFRTLDNNKMTLHVESADANALVRDLASDFDDFAKKRNIKFVIKCDPDIPSSLYVDKQILEKVVMNLLNNAFKYTPDGGEITIETLSDRSKFTSSYRHSHNIRADKSFEDELIIVVRDSGCGISSDTIKDVFERYYQVNTTNLNRHLGTGIGLALVKSLVILHHGSISIFSERNVGTDIMVALPTDRSAFTDEEFADAGESACAPHSSADSQSALLTQSLPDDSQNASGQVAAFDESARNSRPRILLVEDNEDLRTLIAGFLKLHFDIIEASDGVEALDILKNTSVELIISDIMMPNMDGITLCREIKDNIETSHIPVMLLTARTGVDNQLEGADAGADMYFSKPIDFNLLLQSIRNVFQHQQKLREHYARNYYADRTELSSNRQDTDFLNKITEIIDSHLEGDNIDVNFLANELCMSRSKLYAKLKALTGKSIVEFILNYKMRKAARLIVEQDVPLYQIMEKVGIRSQSYFVNAFKKEFGETPSAFIAKHRKKG